MGRIAELKKAVSMSAQTATSNKNLKLKRASATEELEKQMAVFKKYDADKDDKLSRKEIQAYAKGEFKFVIPLHSLDHICEALIEQGSKGVPKEAFYRVRSAVGVARDIVAD